MRCSNCATLNELNRPRCAGCGYWLISATDLPVGAVLSERYQLLNPLGKGGMGMVFKAHDSVLEEDVALKLLRSDIAEEPDAARRFRQEIRLARRVRHRNVCAIHEYGEDGGIRYISMELIEGVDLRQVLRRQGAPAALEALDISIQISEGLEAIHEAGIIHRDLKTANIMMDAQGCVRLMDFGIAKQAAGEPTLGATALGTIMGTPEYMSPEQGRGERTDFRTDVYSLGVMVFEIFTGQLPFKGDTPIATIFKHIQEPPPLAGERAARIPGVVVAVLAQALAKSPEDRYQSVRDMRQALCDARAACGPKPPGASRISAVMPIISGAVAPQLDPAAQGDSLPTPMPTPTAVRTVVPNQARLDEPADVTAATELRGPESLAAPFAAAELVEQGAAHRQQVAVRQAELEGEGRARAGAAAIRTPRGAAGGRTRFWLFAGLGGMLAVVAVALIVPRGYHLLRGAARVAAPADQQASGPSTEARPASVQLPAPASLATSQGVLVIDASPWAEIVSVVGQDGRSQDLGSTRYTPAVVHLPEGVYAVSLKHPQFGSSKVNVTVRASAIARHLVELGRVDPRQYLTEAGL